MNNMSVGQKIKPLSYELKFDQKKSISSLLIRQKNWENSFDKLLFPFYTSFTHQYILIPSGKTCCSVSRYRVCEGSAKRRKESVKSNINFIGKNLTRDIF